MTRGHVCLLLAAIAFPGPSAAQDWTVDLGSVARVRPAHLGSNSYRTDLLPVLAASYGKSLSFSIDDGAKWEAARLGPATFGAVGEFRQSFNDALSRDVFRTRDAVELGGFAQTQTRLGLAELRMRRALNGYRGWSGDLAFDTGGRVSRGLELGAEARLSWADQRFTQEYFGQHRAPPAPFGPPRFHDNDFVSVGIEVDAARTLTPDTRLILELSGDRMLGELPSRGLFPSRNVFTASLGIVRHWSRFTQGNRP
jgi:outer membrane scaffolding protein for murein synthesis (MipA/OmpV family)